VQCNRVEACRPSDAVGAWRNTQLEVDMLAAALGWWLGSLLLLVIWIVACVIQDRGAVA